MDLPESLIQQLAQRRIVPFVGSGVSLAVKRGLFPTWRELLGTLADRLDGEAKPKQAAIVRSHAELDEFNEAADKALRYLGESHFREVMQSRFAVDQPADADLTLPTALWSLRPKLIVTTNYDRVLQWSNPLAQVATNAQRDKLAKLFSASEPDPPPSVWHLHGQIDDLDSLILAPQQYDQLYRDAADSKHPLAAARLQLGTLIGNHPLLFIGFGLQDEYVMDALATVLEIFPGSLRNSYALLKEGDDRARKLWDQHNIHVIECANHGQPLVELVAEMARQTNAAPADSRAAAAGPRVIPPAYIRWLTEQCADITPFGMAPTQGQSVYLQQVYVPPLTSRRVHGELVAEMLTQANARGKKPKPAQSTQPIRAELEETEAKPRLLLKLLGERSLYVSGDPGTGKSTFCRWVAWLAATGEVPSFEVAAPDEFQEQLPDSLRGRLPVLVRLREFREFLPAQPGRRSLTVLQFQKALQDWLDQARPGGLCWSDVEPHLKHGSLLLILDGADELPLTEGDGVAAWSPRESLLAGVIAVAAEWLKRGNRCLLTSRPYGLTPDQVQQLERVWLAEARLDPLPEPLQDLLAARWFVALPKSSADGREIAAAMLAQVRGLAGDVAVLATNPLLLTAICIIYGEGKELPRDKHNLYDRIVNTALHSRYLRGPNVIAPVRARLAAVALGMHTGQPHQPSRQSPVAEVTYEELDQILGVYIGATPETESGFRRPVDAREDLLTHSGLLSQRETDRASFYHLSFQEFLAAERLVLLNPNEEKLRDVFRKRAAQSGWRPTLSFLFGSRVAQPGWVAGVDLLKQLLEMIDVNHVAESLGLALSAVDAFDILLSRDLKLQEPLLARAREICLAAIAQEIEPKSRAELARLLGRIGDPRVADDVRDPTAFVEVAAGTYRVGDQTLAEEYKTKYSWDNRALPDETIRFEQPFQLSKYPVTNGQFQRFVEAGGYDDLLLWQADGWKWRSENNIAEPRLWRDSKWNGMTQPVVGVSWWEADAFCRWAGCRLPTEREWEAAARGPDGRAYPWEGEWDDGICNSYEAGLEMTTPVGIFPRSTATCGAEDMAGNVWEWCDDWFDLKQQVRVLRGGSWSSYAGGTRSAIRGRNSPDDRSDGIGFRVVVCVRTS